MATSSDIICGVCDAQQITKSAEYWCPECEEGLCSECYKYHSISNASKTHGCIAVDQYNKLPSSISEISHHCKDHGIKYTNYCSHHDTLCCPVCISTTHGECKGFPSVQEIIKTAKTSTLLDNMEHSLSDIENNIEKVIQNRENNLSQIKKQRQKFHDQIKQLREKMNSHLDTLEQNLITELNAAEKKLLTKIENFINRLSKERKSAHALKINIKALKEHASDLQTFLGSKTYQPEVEKAEKYIKYLSEDGNLAQLNLKCDTNDKTLETLRAITFGCVSVETCPLSLFLTTEKEKQAQIMSVIPQPSPKSINDIKLSLINTYNIPKPRGKYGYRGCVIQPRGKSIFTSKYTSKLIVLKEDGTEDAAIPCSSDVNDVTTIDDRTVALSTDNGIDILNIDSKTTERKKSEYCFGITNHKGTLLFCRMSKGLQKMDPSDGTITTLVKQDELPYDSYVTTYKDKIYQTNWNAKTVTCYTAKGEMLWEYKNASVIQDPLGIAVDSNGNVYVTSRESNSLVVITADGKDARQLLSQQEGLKIPYGIYIEKTKNNVLIVNDIGPAFLYHVS